MIRRFLAVLLLLPLLACDPATATLVVVGTSATTLAHTDKTLPDHVATWVTGEDCSILRSTQEKGPYCLSEEEIEARNDPGPQVVCYRTLGAIDCYSEPDPEASAFTQVR